MLRRLVAVNLIDFQTSVDCVNGCFGVDKDSAAPGALLRFIFDTRPANERWVDPPPFLLPSPDDLAALQVSPDQTVYVAKDDLDSYFHRIRIPLWMRSWFGLPPVRAQDMDLADVFGWNTLIFPVCCTLPMGPSHSPFLAQSAHEHLVYTYTSLRRVDAILACNDHQLDRARHVIYIDDFNSFKVVSRGDPLPSMAGHDAYADVMACHGLPTKPSKRIEFTPTDVEVLGMDIDGVQHVVGPHPRKINALVCATRGILGRGRCTGKYMSHLLGVWTWFALARRPVFSVFSAIYKFCTVAGHRVFSIWRSVRQELIVMCGLAPLLRSSLTAPWFRLCIATDASSQGEGVVYTRLPPRQLALLSDVPLPLHLGVLHPLRVLHPFLVPCQWRVAISHPWRFNGHIDVLELRAIMAGLRWVASFPDAFGARVLIWCDNTPVVFSMRKGRSSSFGLLVVLRRIAALCLTCNIRCYVKWIPSELNPADKPSRLFVHFAGFDSTRGFPGEGPSLYELAYAPSTVEAYNRALGRFVDWMHARHIVVVSLKALDLVLVEYFQDCYDSWAGGGHGLGAKTLAALSMVSPACKRQFPSASLALRGWWRASPSISRPPLSWPLTVAVAYFMAYKHGFQYGVATLLSFDCYLRISEMVAIDTSHLAFPGDHRAGKAFNITGLRLPRTKTGPEQFVEVLRPEVILLLIELMSIRLLGSHGHHGPLFWFSASKFRRLFNQACAAWSLSSAYTPHSLRHGGATFDFINGMDIERILLRGRWAAHKSCRLYIRQGRSLLLAADVPLLVAAVGDVLSDNIITFFSLAQLH